nr:hypothetical protein GCM10017745_17460 [Saccharothrix mutabilis subsp. capreolus]
MWRIESARLIAGLARMVRDVGLAEELAQDALVSALEQWPDTGIPRNPGAWLMAAAKNRAIDQIRRQRNYERKLAEIGRDEEQRTAPDAGAGVGDIDDDLLRLVFTACHPVLSVEAQVALTLKMLGGSPRRRSRGRSWCPSPPWRSGSCGRRRRWPRRTCRSRCRRRTSGTRGSRPCSA